MSFVGFALKFRENIFRYHLIQETWSNSVCRCWKVVSSDSFLYHGATRSRNDPASRHGSRVVRATPRLY